jgi:hypothetical protein
MSEQTNLKWVRSVVIVHDLLPLDRSLLGNHNGKYQAIELRLRSDGRCFYLCCHSKITMEALAVLDRRNEQWNEFLHREIATPPATEAEFLADAERQRQQVDGAYLLMS